jgi:hypothetical protein
MSGDIGQLVEEGYQRSATFRGLVDTLERLPVLVYIEPGRCPGSRRQRLNGCLARFGATAGPPHLRIIVAVGRATDALIATIGHELQHAKEEVLRGHHDAGTGDDGRPVGANVYETDAAQDVKETILRELRRTRPRRRNGALHWPTRDGSARHRAALGLG